MVDDREERYRRPIRSIVRLNEGWMNALSFPLTYSSGLFRFQGDAS